MDLRVSLPGFRAVLMRAPRRNKQLTVLPPRGWHRGCVLESVECDCDDILPLLNTSTRHARP